MKPNDIDVIHIKKAVRTKERTYVFIGRNATPAIVAKMQDIKLGNPFIIGKHGDRDEVISQFEQHLRFQLIDDEVTKAKINELVERVSSGEKISLVCYCNPKPCHGDVIAQVVKEKIALLNNAA